LARALLRWQHAAGPFWPFVCVAPFLTELNPRPARRRGSTVGTELLDLLPLSERGGRFAALLDLPIERTLAVADELNAAGLTIVPVVQRWSAQPAVLDCRELLGLLLNQAPRQRRRKAPGGLLLLLDAERTGRAGPARSRVPAGAFDNRYTYRSCRFPTAATLARAGYERLLWLSGGEIAADLVEYAASLKLAGFDLVEVRCTLS
jgi:hypothetical protein